MFRCRRVFTASLLRFTSYATRALRHHSAVRCCGLSDCKAAALHRRDARSGFFTRVACERDVPRRSLFDARMTPFAVNATPRRVCKVSELASFSCVRQTRGASTTPVKTPAETEPFSSGSSPQGPASDGKPSKAQQLRQVFKEYGAVGVSFHIGISLISLGIFYVAVSSGIDMTSVLCKLGFSESVVQSKMAAGTSTFVLAYAVHKLFAPVRISITLVSVPLIVRHLRRTGLFKPRTSAP